MFVCQYCGQTPPAVVLEIDHIKPVSHGGDNNADNLITACFECNRGKGPGLLSIAPQTVAEKAEILAEKEAQIKAFQRLQKSKNKRIEKSVDVVEQIFCDAFEKIFTPRFRRSVNHFIDRLGEEKTCWAMDRALSKELQSEATIKYFCGICWNLINGNE
jgi:hypothetical protein